MERLVSSSCLDRPLPPRKILYDSILRMVGDLTGFVTDVGVALRDLVPAVLRDLEEDPENLPPRWRGEEGRCSRIYEAVHATLGALCRTEKKGPPSLVKVGRALWTLTEQGVTRVLWALLGSDGSRVLVDAFSPVPSTDVVPNVTSQWLAIHCKPVNGCASELVTKIRSTLTRQLPVSARAKKIDDHVQTFFERMIYRDAFAEKLAARPNLPYSMVITYAANSAKTDIRNAGTSPVCRALYGAVTASERNKAIRKASESEIEKPVTDVRRRKTTDTDGSLMDDKGIVRDEAVRDDTDQSFDKFWKTLVSSVHQKYPEMAERYGRILTARYRRGHSIEDIALKEGLPKSTTKKLLREARKCFCTSLGGSLSAATRIFEAADA